MTDHQYKIGILGPSGSGKGTQKGLLSTKLHLPSVSMGDLLRAAAKEGGEAGKTIKKTLELGIHVDNSVTSALISNWKEKQGENGYVIEGYPRNREQFDFFESRDHFTHAVVLIISDEEVRVRITGRRICPCGKTYHMKYKRPKHNETCDECGAKLQIRSDSTIEATEKRIKLYHEEMEPLLAEYKKQGILHEINGQQSIDKVHEDILKIFDL